MNTRRFKSIFSLCFLIGCLSTSCLSHLTEEDHDQIKGVIVFATHKKIPHHWKCKFAGTIHGSSGLGYTSSGSLKGFPGKYQDTVLDAKTRAWQQDFNLLIMDLYKKPKTNPSKASDYLYTISYKAYKCQRS